MLAQDKDPIGTALLAIQSGESAEQILVKNRYGSDEDMDPYYLFRSYDEMPELEKSALKRCKGKVLDIGAGAGSHSLYLANKGFDVAQLEYSPGACQVMNYRGLTNINNSNFWEHKGDYDTLLLMMNGIGLVGDIPGLRRFFTWADDILSPDGSIIFDSCDVSYVYQNAALPDGRYFGEIEFKMVYKTVEGPWFKWLFVDPVLLQHEANLAGWDFELLEEDNSFQYLGKLSRS